METNAGWHFNRGMAPVTLPTSKATRIRQEDRNA
jgi:hypothetical protein